MINVPHPDGTSVCCCHLTFLEILLPPFSQLETIIFSISKNLLPHLIQHQPLDRLCMASKCLSFRRGFSLVSYSFFPSSSLLFSPLKSRFDPIVFRSRHGEVVPPSRSRTLATTFSWACPVPIGVRQILQRQQKPSLRLSWLQQLQEEWGKDFFWTMSQRRHSCGFGPLTHEQPVFLFSSTTASLHPSFSWESIRKIEHDKMERPDEGGERPEEVAPLRVIKRGQGSIREQVRRQAALRTVSDIRFGPPRTFSPPDFVAPQPSTSPAIDEQAYELARQSASHRVSKILERNPGRLSALANLRREESQTSLPGSITDTHRVCFH